MTARADVNSISMEQNTQRHKFQMLRKSGIFMKLVFLVYQVSSRQYSCKLSVMITAEKELCWVIVSDISKFEQSCLLSKRSSSKHCGRLLDLMSDAFSIIDFLGCQSLRSVVYLSSLNPAVRWRKPHKSDTLQNWNSRATAIESSKQRVRPHHEV
jgi:hypothetical protein